MSQRILIDPVTRIEGHAKISIFLDDAGEVADARFHVTEFRGFERFCEGRPFFEMAGLSARICGICPVSHLMASAKAGDQILAVDIPPAAEKLRRLMNLGQIVQSHALSFFHLSGPDLLLGWDSDPASRNVFGLIRADPALARGGIRLRQFGQEMIESLGGKKIHPAWCVPGGVRDNLSQERRVHLQGWLPEARATARAALARFKNLLDGFQEEARTFGELPIAVPGSGRRPTAAGSTTAAASASRTATATSSRTAYEPTRYAELIGEAVEPDSYLKSPYFRPLGYPAGCLPRRPAGPTQRLRPHRHAAGRRGAGRVPPTRRADGQLVLLLPLRPADRNPGGDRIHRAAAGRPGHARDAPARRGRRQPARRRRRQRGAARHALPPLPGGPRTACCRRSTSSSPPGRTTWR